MRFRFFSKRDENEESVRGKVVVITGANSGIGKEVALQMAQKGAIVVMACRDLDKGEEARTEIQKKTNSKNIVSTEN